MANKMEITNLSIALAGAEAHETRSGWNSLRVKLRKTKNNRKTLQKTRKHEENNKKHKCRKSHTQNQQRTKTTKKSQKHTNNEKHEKTHKKQKCSAEGGQRVWQGIGERLLITVFRLNNRTNRPRY